MHVCMYIYMYVISDTSKYQLLYVYIVGLHIYIYVCIIICLVFDEIPSPDVKHPSASNPGGFDDHVSIQDFSPWFSLFWGKKLSKKK